MRFCRLERVQEFGGLGCRVWSFGFSGFGLQGFRRFGIKGY